MEATARQRRSNILGDLARNRVVNVSDLSRQFGVSEVSIRRDLEYLERHGLLKRVHGGAVSVPGTNGHGLVHPTPHEAEKQRIGRSAASLISTGDRLIFDSGSTALQVARHISGDLLSSGNLTVITASLPIIYELGSWKGVHLILLGGIYLPEYRVVAGPQTVENLRGLHADKMFLGTDGMTFEHGLTTSNILEAEVDRAMVRAVAKVIVVADSSKVGGVGLTTIMPLREVDILITDDSIPADFVCELRKAGVEVMQV